MKINIIKTFLIIGMVIFFIHTSGCSKKNHFQFDPSDVNLIFINIDSLRHDHLGCYGYFRDTSPNIDLLAKESLMFTNSRSNSSFTKESVSTLFTGLLPSYGGHTGWRGSPVTKTKTLAELFRDNNFNTGFLSNTKVIGHKNYRRGFSDIWINPLKGLSGNAPDLSKRANIFINKSKDKKFFLYIHFLDPHAPYKPDPKYYKKFSEKIYPSPLKLYGYIRNNCDELIKGGFGKRDARFEDLVLRYDAEISSVDDSIKLIIDELKKTELYKKTVIIVNADHGEEFLEHNFVEHGWTLFEESIRVPLLIHFPGLNQQLKIDTDVSTVDLYPSICELFGLKYNKYKLNGESFFKRGETGKTFNLLNKNSPYMGELLIQHRNIVRTIISEGWKYTAAQKWLDPAERPSVLKTAKEIEKNKLLHLDIFGGIVYEALFNLSTDKSEKINVLNIAKFIEFRKIIKKYEKGCKLNSANINKSGKEMISEEDRRKLKSLGYL